MTVREELAYEQLEKFFPQALQDVKSPFVDRIMVNFRDADDEVKTLNKTKDNVDLIARFHAIQAVANKDIATIHAHNVNFLLMNKRLELLRLACDNGFIDPEYRDVRSFGVQFLYKITVRLSGTQVTAFNKLIQLLRVIHGWRGMTFKSNNTGRNTAFSQVIFDAMKLWFFAFRSGHPDLHFWKSFPDEIVGLNEERSWPIRISGAARDYLKKANKLLSRSAQNMIIKESDEITEYAHKTQENKK